ncbi:MULTISPECIES: hypothetical protein [unclassified Phaeobacter]|uniref:hypothetical protein n=1 Tax=unclassified Phaeobacter TaxID=2621772 RepID=UPI003A853B2F
MAEPRCQANNHVCPLHWRGIDRIARHDWKHLEQNKKGSITAPFFVFFLPVGLADLVIGRTLRKGRPSVNMEREKNVAVGGIIDAYAHSARNMHKTPARKAQLIATGRPRAQKKGRARSTAQSDREEMSADTTA